MEQGNGEIVGTVADRTGAAILNAKVTATNTDTGVQTTRQSTGSGSYSIAPLPPGNYNVEVVARGFQRLLQENVRVDALRRVGLNLKLTVGSASQTVTITDAPPFLDTTNATLGGTIENEFYSNMPLSMGGAPRDPAAFQYLGPGVQQGPPPTSSSGLTQGIYGGVGQQSLNENYIEGMPVSNIAGAEYQQAARNSFMANTSTAAFDDYFEYKIGEPVTVRKNESALVPILQTKIAAERVTLWSPERPTPLRALWVTNTSNLTLDRGSFSIVEDGNFGGEGLLDPIHPAEKRLLSYAVDQAVRVTTETPGDSTRVTSISAAKGVLVLRNTRTAQVTYVVRNAAPEARAVVIEHPIRQGYELDSSDPAASASDSQAGGAEQGAAGNKQSPAGSRIPDAKPEETTPTLYRYKVEAAAGETVRLHVGEHQDGGVSYRLTDSNDSQLNVILNQVDHNEATERALQPIFDARRHVADMQVEVNVAETNLRALRADEERQRSNVTALANVDKSVRERFVRDLNATEDQIAAGQKGLAASETKLQAAQDDLANKIESLQIDEKL
jgi:hypothetical protein